MIDRILIEKRQKEIILKLLKNDTFINKYKSKVINELLTNWNIIEDYPYSLKKYGIVDKQSLLRVIYILSKIKIISSKNERFIISFLPLVKYHYILFLNPYYILNRTKNEGKSILFQAYKDSNIDRKVLTVKEITEYNKDLLLKDYFKDKDKDLGFNKLRIFYDIKPSITFITSNDVISLNSGMFELYSDDLSKEKPLELNNILTYYNELEAFINSSLTVEEKKI